jgi:hypothetical protein
MSLTNGPDKWPWQMSLTARPINGTALHMNTGSLVAWPVSHFQVSPSGRVSGGLPVTISEVVPQVCVTVNYCDARFRAQCVSWPL